MFSRCKARIAAAGIIMILGQIPALAASTEAIEAPATQEQLDLARKLTDDNPANSKLRFDYAELLRRSGNIKQAQREYLTATEIDANYLLAYHQLAQCCTDPAIANEAVSRLTHLMEQRPDDFMVRVALSEMLEHQGKFYEASRPLVEMVFKNAVPAKYTNKLNSRILFLQAKARAQHVDRGAREGHHGTGKVEVVESVPVPLPEESLSRGLQASRLEKSSDGESFGHSRLHH